MSDSDQFIFGYGSLIQSQARAKIVPSRLDVIPVNVVGLQRGWFGQFSGAGVSTTYLAAVADPDFNCNGVIFTVSEEQLATLDQHEAGYQRERIDQNKATRLDGSKAAIDGDIWFYTSPEKRGASPEFPIRQSYVDTCVSGCLEIEETFALAKEAKFAETFLKTSTDWSTYWINDRIPASGTIPHQSKIDQLLKRVLGEEHYIQSTRDV